MAKSTKEPKKPKGEPRCVPLSASFTISESSEVIRQAGDGGKSDFIRDAVLKALKKGGFAPAK